MKKYDEIIRMKKSDEKLEMSGIIFQDMTIWLPFSATILKEENSYVSICPEADVICKGETVEEAIENLKKEVEKFLGEELPQGFSKIVYY